MTIRPRRFSAAVVAVLVVVGAWAAPAAAAFEDVVLFATNSILMKKANAIHGDVVANDEANGETLDGVELSFDKDVTVEGNVFEIVMGRGGRVWVNDRPHDVDLRGVDRLSRYSLLVDHRSYEAHVEQMEEEECCMVVAGRSYSRRSDPPPVLAAR